MRKRSLINAGCRTKRDFQAIERGFQSVVEIDSQRYEMPYNYLEKPVFSPSPAPWRGTNRDGDP